jgi:dihydroorotate dehydrogenase
LFQILFGKKEGPKPPRFKVTEQKTTKVELIHAMMNNHFKEINKSFENQLSLLQEKNYEECLQKIQLFDGKEQSELTALIISKNSLLIIKTNISCPNKISLINLNKTFIIQTNSIEEGFIYHYTDNSLIISFFTNLF